MFIPADAGNYFSALVDCGTPLGLSPLARGTRHRVASPHRHARFIPAGAGNTFPESKAIKKFTVYPRWRGEHRYVSISAAVMYGLSPLARGTQMQ
ncbi:hypothetical protein SEENIN0B_03016 [Salmonella enterica subsp. enterica serovar Infantis str. SARB27]|uniref:Uncharacterized protein n=1 Tax=Salmonella enterica subsp. enterica serovar Infantis str. SARB27 TaxID=596155 RepID=A0A6C8GC23_SALIN|nr:hypothetical protein SEENIN0B_03016 [Salmonella enterica subsp. enterica serovar Infantis str. SARB27]